jgi:hypothetical protein
MAITSGNPLRGAVVRHATSEEGRGGERGEGGEVGTPTAQTRSLSSAWRTPRSYASQIVHASPVRVAGTQLKLSRPQDIASLSLYISILGPFGRSKKKSEGRHG